MQLLSIINGSLRLATTQPPAKADALTTGLKALDELLPTKAFRSGAVHEVLSQGDSAWFFALLLAHSALGHSPAKGAIIWSDPQGELYPPALGAMLSLDRIYLLQTDNAKDELWALCQCLQCKGVSAVIASPRRLSRIEARRLQLSTEQGGGIGILLRPLSDLSAPYAAATRWQIAPLPGDGSVQRWQVQLIHGHGGHIGKCVVLEVDRDRIELDSMRAFDVLAHRPSPTPIAKASA